MQLFLIFMFVICLQTVQANNKAERLLLNDPALIMERLTQLENTVQQQAATIQTQAQQIHQLQNEINSSASKSLYIYILSMNSLVLTKVIKCLLYDINVNTW